MSFNFIFMLLIRLYAMCLLVGADPCVCPQTFLEWTHLYFYKIMEAYYFLKATTLRIKNQDLILSPDYNLLILIFI